MKINRTTKYLVLAVAVFAALVVCVRDMSAAGEVGYVVSVSNAGGTAAVNVQDGGNSLTVDGTVIASISGGTVTATLDSSSVTATLANSAAYAGSFTPTMQLPLTASEYHVGEVGGRIVTATYTLQRPADTAIYAANDAINVSTTAPVPFTVTNISRVAGGGGEIMRLIARTDVATATARLRIHVFNYPPTPLNDNAAYRLLWANGGISLGYIDLPALTTEGTGSTCSIAIASPGTVGSNMPFAYWCATGSRDLYFLPEILDATTLITSTQIRLDWWTEAY